MLCSEHAEGICMLAFKSKKYWYERFWVLKQEVKKKKGKAIP
jgi:hypothetical protein